MDTQKKQANEQQAATYCYFTVKQFCEKHKAFRVGGVRGQIFNQDKIGLKESGAIVRIGRKILICEPRWFAWLEAQNQGGK